MNHSFAQQWFTAPYLLKLETQNKLSQQRINDVESFNDIYGPFSQKGTNNGKDILKN